jgi:hypothetical protein
MSVLHRVRLTERPCTAPAWTVADTVQDCQSHRLPGLAFVKSHSGPFSPNLPLPQHVPEEEAAATGFFSLKPRTLSAIHDTPDRRRTSQVTADIRLADFPIALALASLVSYQSGPRGSC